LVEFYIPLLELVFISGLILEALCLWKPFRKVEDLFERLGTRFFYGAFMGIILSLFYMMSVYGLRAYVKPNGQTHYLTLLWLILLALYAFHKSDKTTILRKALFAAFFIIMVYVAHDFFWITKTTWFGITTPFADKISPTEWYYLGSYLRIINLTALSIYHLEKYLKASKKFIFFFIIQILYHAALIIFNLWSEDYVFIGLLFDALPFLFILKKKDGKERND
jgi:hypothetical protein